jgi:SMI1/KNR4 family protein SUKH-1
MPTSYTRSTALCLRLRARALYTSNGINYPPVTPAQVAAAESRLGFQLPAMLRELYTIVANGASFFAPGEWFHGITDTRPGARSDTPTIDKKVGDGPRPFDVQTVTLLRAHPGSYIVCETIPAGFVRLTHIGGGDYVYLDGFTGHLYIKDDHFDEHDEFAGNEFSWCARSLEEWAERNLALSPGERYLEGKYLPRHPLTTLTAKKGEDANSNSDGTTPTNRQLNERSLLTSPPITKRDNEAEDLREQLCMRLQDVRKEIVRQIYQLDEILLSTQELGNRLAKEFANCQAIQRLADAEAQVYALEDEARFPE